MKITKSNKQIVLSALDYAEDLKRAASVASLQSLIAIGHVKPFISQNEAYKLYGESNVKNWVKFDKIKRFKDGDRNCKLRYSRIDLEALANANHRAEWFINNIK